MPTSRPEKKNEKDGAYGFSFYFFSSACVRVLRRGRSGSLSWLSCSSPTSTDTHTHTRRIGRRRPQSKWNKSHNFLFLFSKDGKGNQNRPIQVFNCYNPKREVRNLRLSYSARFNKVFFCCCLGREKTTFTRGLEGNYIINPCDGIGDQLTFSCRISGDCSSSPITRSRPISSKKSRR